MYVHYWRQLLNNKNKFKNKGEPLRPGVLETIHYRICTAHLMHIFFRSGENKIEIWTNFERNFDVSDGILTRNKNIVGHIFVQPCVRRESPWWRAKSKRRDKAQQWPIRRENEIIDQNWFNFKFQKLINNDFKTEKTTRNLKYLLFNENRKNKCTLLAVSMRCKNSEKGLERRKYLKQEIKIW